MARYKFYEARMAGYIAAYNIAKKDGIEALEKELKIRNMLKIDVSVKGEKIREYFDEISTNLYHNVLTTVAWTLHDKYGFGKKRIHEFIEEFNKTVQATLDLDYLGGHYVKLEDFALELNQKYNLGIDYIRVAVCQDVHDEGNVNYRVCKIDKVLQSLREGGYGDAATFIEENFH